MNPVHHQNQDTNDRFLANIQRNGTFSVIPRIAAGEVSPDGLIAIGQVAKEYGLYTKVDATYSAYYPYADRRILFRRSLVASVLICSVLGKTICRQSGRN